MAAISGTAVAVAAVGAVLAYSGLKNKSISNTLRYIVAGKDPATSPALASSAVSGASDGSGTDTNVGAAPSGSNQKAYVISELRKHFNRAATAGFAGNIQIESNFDPTAFNPGEGAIGFCQWEGGRRVALDAHAKILGKSETDPAAQISYLLLEMNTAFAAVRLQLAAPGLSASQCASIIDAQYEISSGAMRTERQDAAEAIYASIA